MQSRQNLNTLHYFCFNFAELTKKQVSSSPVEIPKTDAVLLRILEVLRLQQNIHPDCLDSSSLDLNSIFFETLSVSFIQTLSKEDSFSIRLVKAVMEFLQHLPPKKIRWFKEVFIYTFVEDIRSL